MDKTSKPASFDAQTVSVLSISQNSQG